MALGVTQQTPGVDRHLLTQRELEARLRVLMGGYAAEALVLGAISSGAEDDLRKATELGFEMVAHYGMSERLGPVFYEHRSAHPFLGQQIVAEATTSDATVRVIEEEVRRVLAEALEGTRGTLRVQRRALDAVVAELLEHETLEKEELTRILEANRAPSTPAGSTTPPPAGATTPSPIDTPHANRPAIQGGDATSSRDGRS
jgi:cell division protease FtsH